MLRVYNCLTVDHNLNLVLLAGIVCLASAITTFRLYQRTIDIAGPVRLLWLGLTGLATGCGIWATHFIAMVAYEPNLPTSYEPTMTALSLGIAVVVSIAGFGLTLAPFRLAAPLGGVLVGMGIGAMHFVGMAGFQVSGHVVFAQDLVVVALLLGISLSMAALYVAREHPTFRGRLGAAGLLTLAICGLHFTSMGAVGITPDLSVAVPPQAVSSIYLALFIAGIAIMLLAGCFASASIDQHARRNTRKRMRELADVAIEGLVICDGDTILDANRSFLRLAGTDLDALVGRSFSRDLLILGEDGALDASEGHHDEAEMRLADGRRIPVEVIARTLTYDSRARRVYAVRDLTERRQAERRIHFLAHHDSLTGLSNRVTFADRLDECLAKAKQAGESVAVLCLDLDRFKEVNDVFGHQSGDAVLVEMANRLKATIAEDDLVARLGGDEFSIIQYGGVQPETAGTLAERLIEAASRELQFSGQSTVMGVSIGIAVYPNDGADAATLVANADTALYRAKSEGRGTFRYFEPAMDQKLRERRTLAQDLRRAVAMHEIEVHYQPQAEASSGDVVGFEALVRWRHPTRGDVSPSEFIPIAEETGLITTLGDWVLRSVCREAASWPKPLRVAVNLSAVQFQQGNLPEMVHQILLDTGLAASRLELEITETVLIKDFQRAIGILRRLKALGVRIAMDDFGTGYSSLSNLQAFPFDKLKIDQTFVAQLDCQPKAAAIIRAVLGLGKSLSIPVVAEGVETQAQLDFLLNEACEEVQGYMLGRPDAIENFAVLVGKPEKAQGPVRASAVA